MGANINSCCCAERNQKSQGINEEEYTKGDDASNE